MKRFKTIEGNYHEIDDAGNHFIDGRCVNPLSTSQDKIGSTYPKKEDIVTFKLNP